MRYLLLLLMFVSLVCAAAVYMQTDSNDNVSYSDTPSPNAKQVDVPMPSTIQTAPAVTTKHKVDESEAQGLGPTEHQPYTEFEIASPQDQQTFQNTRDIPVELDAAPRLQKGDSIQLFVDGAKYRDPWFTQHTAIYLLDRGTHTITAELMDDKGQPLKTSNTVTVFIHYAALGG
jgi:hypothetical protein